MYAPDIIGYHKIERKDNYGLYVNKIYCYGLGEGAVYAKHSLKFGSIFAYINYIIEIAKPIIKILINITLFRKKEIMIYYNILKGRLRGYFEYKHGRYE
ncbi:unnamed protein product [marine sediment metagenome]|uniref:Uncharacterized protein n=1 Tax=marine sediment metagenome TaxID=412755 RepID=X0V8E6_9ZZZZ